MVSMLRFRVLFFKERENESMIRNKKTIINIMRLLIAVFLFVLIAPIKVYAEGEGESVSENGGDNDYTTWTDAFNDSDYTDNLAEIVAKYWTTSWLNYVGTGSDVIESVSELLGNQYDNTKDLYENIYPYILPYSRQTINQINPGDLSDSTYGKPIHGKNNLKLVQKLSDDMGKTLNDFQTIATNKNKSGDDITPDVFPSWFHIATKFPAANLPDYPSDYDASGDPCVIMRNPDGSPYAPIYDYYYHDNYDVSNINVCIISEPYPDMRYAFYTYDSNHNFLINTELYWITYYGGFLSGMDVRSVDSENYYSILNKESETNAKVYFWGSGYIYDEGHNKTYYWDADKKTLYFLGIGRYSQYWGSDPDTGDIVNSYEVNIINSVDFNDFQDLINQLIIDTNNSNNISNQLLIELLLELRNQRDNYIQLDGDDIYDYIDYMFNKLQGVLDIHIEIPELSHDTNGIVDGITALLNFLANIIRTLGSLVQSLLEGLLHLFVPTQADWDDINLQFETLTAPLGWIKEFIVEATSNISLLLFGRNVTDFTVAESVDIENVSASEHGSVDIGSGSVTTFNVVYDQNGAPKIPVHFDNSSSEYFSNIGDCYIIDMSWYTPFKPVGDIIVICFCWLMFIWRTLRQLPNIINGSGSVIDSDVDNHLHII